MKNQRALENNFSMSLAETLDLIAAIPESDSDMIPYYKSKYNKGVKQAALGIINLDIIGVTDWQSFNSAKDIESFLLQTGQDSRVCRDIAIEIADRMFIEQKK